MRSVNSSSACLCSVPVLKAILILSQFNSFNVTFNLLSNISSKSLDDECNKLIGFYSRVSVLRVWFGEHENVGNFPINCGVVICNRFRYKLWLRFVQLYDKEML
jgi:hypothetical protein